MRLPPRVRTIVGDDIASVLEDLRVDVVQATPITSLPSGATDRASFRIVLADGRIVKARRMRRAEKANRFVGLLRHLEHDRWPAVLALAGPICVEQWVEGTPLSELPGHPDRIARAADILGGLHATAQLGKRRLRTRSTLRPVLQRAQQRLAKLAAARVIERPEALALLRALRRFAPQKGDVGLTHNDFCAENIVEDPLGRLVVVDNEGLRLGFLDFDLARTWYRWPMSELDWRLFLERYATWRDPSPDAAHAPFWRIAAVLKSLDLRVSRYPTRTATPIGRLRRLLAELDGASGAVGGAEAAQHVDHVEQRGRAQDAEHERIDERAHGRLDPEER